MRYDFRKEILHARFTTPWPRLLVWLNFGHPSRFSCNGFSHHLKRCNHQPIAFLNLLDRQNASCNTLFVEMSYEERSGGSEQQVSLLEQCKQWARAIKRDTFALALACRDQRVPWYAKATAACVVAYAFSPIDLIPDFIPILGYVDDLLLVPLGIIFVVRMIPPEVMQDLREQAQSLSQNKPKNWIGGAFIISIWLLLGAWILWYFARRTIFSPICQERIPIFRGIGV